MEGIKEVQESQELMAKTVGDLRKKVDTFIEKNPNMETKDFVKSSDYKVFIEKVEADQKKLDEAIKANKIANAMKPKDDQAKDDRESMIQNLRAKGLMAGGFDPRDYGIKEDHMKKDFGFKLKAAHQTGDLERAGALTKPPEVMTEIVDLNRVEISKIRPIANVIRSTFADTEIMTQTAHGNAYYYSELGTISKNEDDKFGLEKLPVHKLVAYSYATHEMLQDSALNFEAHLTKDFGIGMAKRENAKFVNGTGVGEPLGFMNSAVGLTAVNSGIADAIDADTLKKVFYTPKDDYVQSPSWVMNRLTTYEVSILKDGIGGYYFQSAPDGGLFTIMGAPIVNAQDMPDVAANAYPIAFGDFKQGYYIKDLAGSELFIKDIYSAKATGVVEFMWIRRNGGMPVVKEALVKYKIAV